MENKCKCSNKLHRQETHFDIIIRFKKEILKLIAENRELKKEIKKLKKEIKNLGQKELQLMIINFQVIGDLKREIKKLKGELK